MADSALLVARARVKAIRSGTTLESEVERFLTRYVGEPDVDVGAESANHTLSNYPNLPIRTERRAGSQAFTPRAVPIPKTNSVAAQSAVAQPVKAAPQPAVTAPRAVETSDESATRSEAYRRLTALLGRSG